MDGDPLLQLHGRATMGHLADRVPVEVVVNGASRFKAVSQRVQPVFDQEGLLCLRQWPVLQHVHIVLPFRSAILLD
jgi:hypothetical protein